MNKTLKLIILSCTSLLFATQAQAGYSLKKKIGEVDTKFVLFGFSQLEARGGDGVIKDNQDASVLFKAQRIRLGTKYIAGPLRGKLFLDFNKAHSDKGGIGVPDMIKDAFVSYYVNNALAVKVGAIKMPHGMSFTIPGWNLDVVERGFDKALAMERNMGVMLSGRAIGDHPNCKNKHKKVNGFEMGHERPWVGFGYDLMIGNQAGRSGAVTNAKAGNANSYAARVMYDWYEGFHMEASYAISEQAGGIIGFKKSDGTKVGAVTEDYKSFNFGIDSHFGKSNAKFEMYRSENVKGVKGWDINTYAITGTHYVNDTFELALKHIQGESEKGGKSTELGNTYVGFNYYIAPFDNKMSRGAKRKRNAHRIQLNYVVASGDTSGSDAWNGLKGYKDDAWLMQYQYKF
jgi:hypothetical protein